MTLAWNDSNRNIFGTAFIAHARLNAPVTPDNPMAPLDNIAMAIWPSNNQDCAAVRDPGAPTAYDYTTNSNNPANPPPGALALTGGRGLLRYVDSQAQKHAEMKMVDGLVSAGYPLPAYLGISKRCCLLCDLGFWTLGQVGFPIVGRRGCHGGIFDTGWRFPAAILNAGGGIQTYLGVGAWNIYVQLSAQNQQAALNLIQTNIGQYARALVV